MIENNPKNIEGEKPLSLEEIEALKQRIAAAEQAGANEMLTALEKNGTQEPGVPFDNGPSDQLVNDAKKTGIRLDVVQKPERKMSDKTQEYVARFENSKSVGESKGIMNEVLTASQNGEIPPDEAVELLDQSNNFQEAA